MQCPPDYMAVAAMVSLSAVIGRKGMVRPRKFDDWTVCPNLWGLAIGRPSAMKTPPVVEALKPLQRLDIAAKTDYDGDIETYKAEKTLAKLSADEAEKAARKHIKEKNPEKAKAVLLENPPDIAEPTRRRLIVNDATVEKLGEILNENPNGVLLFRDEIFGFLKTIDREDRSNDRAFFLEAFDGKGRYTFDRIARGTLDIESVCVSIIGCIQPSRLEPYLSGAIKGGSGDDGMLQRFQLAVWPNLTAWRAVDRWPDTDAKNAAFDVVNRLSDWDGFPADAPAKFTPTAQALFDEWFADLHKKLRGDEIHPAIESHLGKYKSLAPSLAVLIHLADEATHSALIGENATLKALAWCEYLESHMHRIYGAAVDPVDTNALTILAKIKGGKLADGFGTGDIKRGGWTGLTDLESIKAALIRLCEHGYLVEEVTSTGGRPSIKYRINPAAMTTE
jgi:putative DNA primase/helicase